MSLKLKKPIPIIEYIKDRQRNPKELFEYLQKDIEDMNKVIVIFSKNKELYYAVGCPNRDYTSARIFWDLNQITTLMMENK